MRYASTDLPMKPLHAWLLYRWLLASAIVAGLPLLSVAAPAPREAAPISEQRITSDRVLGSLNETLGWYREARLVLRPNGAAFAREEEQTALAVVRQAFETARAQAALLVTGRSAPTTTPQADAGPLAGKRTEIKTAIQADEQEIERIRKRIRAAPRAQRPALENDLAVATNRRDLNRVRLDFLARLEESNLSSSAPEADLGRQIQTLEESLPELRSTNNGGPVNASPAGGTSESRWGLVQSLIGNYHTKSSLDRLGRRTQALEGSIEKDLQETQASLHPLVGQLQALTADPSPGGSLADGQKAFRTLLQQSKQLGEVLLSLRKELALVRRFGVDLEGWTAWIDRERWQIMQNLGLGLSGVVVALVATLVGGALWRKAAERYVRDVYRRHLLLIVRNVVIVTAMTLVLVFHFASEFTGLVTGLGFAAAGIAFALQNVILALAGYFSMAAPNGIRVGDRVSLQGPFSYVQGEVLEIGLVRIRLREVAGDPLRPTGRIVVFPNSVAFTGSFFKHPSSEERDDGPRQVGRSAAA